MTQESRPQADNIANFPLPSDPGPYSADQWSAYMQVSYTGDEQTTQGPLVSYLNELVTADNGSNAVTVDTGAGYVNGHFFVSDEQETFAIPAGPAGTRTDRVVMVENNTNAEITQTVAGRPFLFPNDLSEYSATPAVPAYSTRLVIVRGNDAGALPAIDQGNTVYMVELARYDIENTPTISSHVDYRQFVATPMSGLHKIRETILTGATEPITISNIPQVFTHLIIRASLKSTQNVLQDTAELHFNGTVGGVEYGWFYRQYDTFGAAVVTVSANSTSQITCGNVAGSSANQDADSFGTVEVIIHDYTSLNAKNVIFRSSHMTNTPNIYGAWGSGYWDRSLTPVAQEGITRVSFYAAPGTWAIGSTLSVYGVT